VGRVEETRALNGITLNFDAGKSGLARTFTLTLRGARMSGALSYY
jgi:hypothetical protein